jgi:KAP family P-loop domain
LLQLLRALRAFGVEPASLLATQSNNPRLQDLEKQTSFRFHFAREFAEVTAALGSRRMVIFIDDLDRCQPKQVYEMLESVNFLVSSGRCFIVLGLALERVERAVGLALKNIADAEMPSKTQEENPADTAKRRADYARHYLGKLINIEVRVPVATTKNYADLLRQRGQSAEESAGTNRFRSWGAVALGLVIFFLVLGAIFDAGRRVGDAKAPNPVVKVKETNPSSSGSTTGSSNTHTAQTRGNTIATFGAGARPLDPWWILGPVALAVLGIVLWRWRASAPVEETDSDEFSNSLDHWLPVAAGVSGATPRSLKRFVNRVRYYAMLQKSLFSPAEKIPEGKLVALAAYQERYPGDVEKNSTPLGRLPLGDPLRRDFSTSAWRIDDSTYHRFRTLSVGVHFRADDPPPETAPAEGPPPAESPTASNQAVTTARAKPS